MVIELHGEDALRFIEEQQRVKTPEEIKSYNDRLVRAKKTYDSIKCDNDDGFVRRGSNIIKIKNPKNSNERVQNILYKLLDKLRGY
jgi:hypothetical protein